MFDHIAVRVETYPADPFRIELFHSVIASASAFPKAFSRLSDYLDRLPFNGPRYVSPQTYESPIHLHAAASLVASHPKQWRLATMPSESSFASFSQSAHRKN